MISELTESYEFLDTRWAKRLVRAYGADARKILRQAKTLADLGQDFGATLTEVEVRWLMDHEFAKCAEDIVWRRNKLGLRMDAEQIATLDVWMGAK